MNGMARHSAPRGRQLHKSVAVGASAAVVAGVLLLWGQAPADASAATTLRVTPAHSRVSQSGHTWVSDRAVARGGHVVSTRKRHPHEQKRFRYARSGPFSYVLHLAPGTYAVRVDAVDTRARASSPWALSMTSTATGSSRHKKVIGHLGRQRVYEVTWTTRLPSGALTLRFGRRAEVTGLAAVRLAPMPTSTSTSTHAPAPRTSTPASRVATTGAPPAASTTSSAPVTATTTAPSTSAVPAGDVTPEKFGAAGDGVTDDTAALQRTFDQAAGRTVFLPAGHVYADTNVLQLRVAGLHVTGPGELLATNEQDSSVWIEADNVTVDGGVVIKTAHTTKRWTTWQQMGVRVDGHSGTVLRDVTVDGSAAAGIYVGGGAHDFVLDHDVVQDTRADGIHMTDGSYDGQVIAPTIRMSGDDAVAVVSYKSDGTICHDITVTSPTVRGTTGGRGLSVVGGQNIHETNIDVDGSSAAAVYIAAEGAPWYTAAPTDVTFTGGQITDANAGTNDNHGAVLVYSGESDVVPSHITVSNLSITNTRSTACRDFGVVQDGAAPSSILFSHFTISGGPAMAYEGDAPQSSFQARSITQNGRVLPDRG